MSHLSDLSNSAWHRSLSQVRLNCEVKLMRARQTRTVISATRKRTGVRVAISHILRIQGELSNQQIRFPLPSWITVASVTCGQVCGTLEVQRSAATHPMTNDHCIDDRVSNDDQPKKSHTVNPKYTIYLHSHNVHFASNYNDRETPTPGHHARNAR